MNKEKFLQVFDDLTETMRDEYEGTMFFREKYAEILKAREYIIKILENEKS